MRLLSSSISEVARKLILKLGHSRSERGATPFLSTSFRGDGCQGRSRWPFCTLTHTLRHLTLQKGEATAGLGLFAEPKDPGRGIDVVCSWARDALPGRPRRFPLPLPLRGMPLTPLSLDFGVVGRLTVLLPATPLQQQRQQRA